MIKFNAKTEIIISEDLAKDVWGLIEEEGVRSAALIADENISSNGDFKSLINFLEKKIKLFPHIIESQEPTTDIVNKFTPHFRGKSIDMFIGIGGGSVIDLTKALSVMAVNEGKVEDYHGTGKPFKAGVKKIMIPTTSGTGSEVTPGAVLVNVNTKFKRAIGGKYVAPDYAVLNPHLTLSMPDNVLASTGMDALGHAIESYTAKCSNIITRMYSKEAFYLIYNNLPKALEDKKNIELRKNLLLGSSLAGYAIFNSNTGAAHSMAYPLGIYNQVPHGVAVARLLPKIVRKNVGMGCFLYADLYDLIEGAEKEKDKKAKSELFAGLLEEYKPIKFIGKKFSDYGINGSNLEFLAERGLDLKSALSNNPVEFKLDDAKEALKELI